ncbi:discoidin domain-containing receptor 2-like isoform X2 [Zootermopsis nevadensis]|uniref:discoidin domain-containing receptor 2-like isoform X2 n=1 Tax=Zootermopsis nevadensis TaxID=136037 RepID=UPI000B8E99AD|nr:discoidin domain-containing receptor 2-like isoform X2 [Zootermopsis nevadensis]
MLVVAAMLKQHLVPRGSKNTIGIQYCNLILIATTSLLLLATTPIAGFDIRPCDFPLGMESGSVPDSAITASSSYVPNVGPHQGRLRVDKTGGAWCPKQQVERGVREYLEVDLGDVYVLTGVETQGRYDRGRGQEYVEEYMIEYWRPGLGEWKQYSRWDGKQILSGNSDTATVVSHRLMPPVYVSKVRVLPYSVHRRTVCLRVELRGCLAEGGIVSYQVPEDTAREPGQDLRDSSYDGVRLEGHLVGGLGRLVDGEVGGDNFKLDIGYGKGNGWVAWRNDSFPNHYVEMIFEFDQVRNFSVLHIFTNNFFTKNVQVFAKAKVMFSVGGQFYNGRPLVYTYMPDTVLENARNVSINLHGRFGRFVKVQLYFAARWIMISEVVFESAPLMVNITEEIEASMSDDEFIVNSADTDSTWDTFETIAAPKDGQGYVEVVIGGLTAIMLLLLIVFVVILVLSRRQKLQGSPTILRNPFGVTINMKDLLMNLAPVNSNGMVHVSNHPTPASQDPPSDPPSLTFEQYRSPLVNTYYGPNYATLRSNTDRDGSVSMPEETERQESDDTVTKTPTPPPATGSFSSLQFRSLQTTPVVGPKSQVINLCNYFPRVASDPPSRKRYHTAPREKHRVPPPVVTWNIAPSMGHAYKCREAELVPIPRYCLRMVEKIGTCHAGEIILCETEGLEDIVPGVGRTVAVRTSNSKSSESGTDALREVRFLASLSDPNVVRVLGICTAEQPPWTVLEYPDMGDLAHYLQYRVPVTASVRPSTNLQALSYGCLIFMATQIASGMRYLESKNVVHKDLAARNCLVGRGYHVKLADVAMCSGLYHKDYSEIGSRPPAPIRWLPWESILLDRYTCSSSTWSFAVTLWEILSLAREKPFQHLSNEQVIQNAEHMYYGGELQVLLPKPTLCPVEVYDLMCECWRRDEGLRPTFKEIYMFLKRKNMGYRPGD